MRIAIVTDYYYPTLGGITEHVHGQASYLQSRGHEVTVITGNVHKPPAVVDGAYRPEDHVDFEVVRAGRTFGFYGNGAQTLHTLGLSTPWTLKNLFRRRDFDVIHTHAPYNPSIVQAVPFVRNRRAAVVGTFHSVFPESKKLKVAAYGLRPSIERLDGRIVVSKACIESLDPYFPFDYTVIPNGIDETHFTPDATPFPEFADDRQNILYVGRFDPRNGLDTMLHAFTLVRRARGDTVRLIVVGDGPLRSYYQRMVPRDVAPSIVWAGRVNWDRPRYFASADLLCTPCERASFGMVLLEAMSCGLPVVASRNSGFQLVMEHQKHGLMVDDAEDAGGFARAIEQLLDRPDDMVRMGCAGRQAAVERFSWTSVGARLEEYYGEVIAARKAAV